MSAVNSEYYYQLMLLFCERINIVFKFWYAERPKLGITCFALVKLCRQSSDLAPGTITNNLFQEGLFVAKTHIVTQR
ncbi:unnamed protein product [Photorhabdus laumondii subsp. laumondii TTO1]|uniref:Photorhabdus luminescens subsp. laumondii TTO1 complete genome segment 13/17 n=1 Tax=Photorhabdus laumondii subsp. laumondii (strain DSM 15139 / CIP 105565 / TT01) TaxID=243265 RepID=Q7N175_PHOLL|nr:unnamed protein product [Photorhabdus laumondii subsp. laumondii TTO1]